MDYIDVTMASGYSKPITCITMEGKSEVLDILMRHSVLYSNKAALDQFMSGLSTFGVLDYIRKYPSILESYFVVVCKRPELTAGLTQWTLIIITILCASVIVYMNECMHCTIVNAL